MYRYRTWQPDVPNSEKTFESPEPIHRPFEFFGEPMDNRCNNLFNLGYALKLMAYLAREEL